MVRDKGIIELGAAWARLRKQYSDLHLLLVGPFEEQDPVPQTVRHQLEADPRVHVMGADWDTPPLYSIMDVVALPTYREGFPNVPLEAAAMNVPVVATRIPGCVEAVEDEVTGILVPPRDPVRLAEAISRYLESPQLRREHGVAARRRVLLMFRPEDIWVAMLKEYGRLLSLSAPRA
jgi:glycosyltransferase involved in cell wall biosynthesis